MWRVERECMPATQDHTCFLVLKEETELQRLSLSLSLCEPATGVLFDTLHLEARLAR